MVQSIKKIALMMLLFMPILVSAEIMGRYELEALYVEKISLFTEWPKEKFDNSTTFKIYIYGSSKIYKPLKKSFGSRKHCGKDVEIIETKNLDLIKKCDILIIPDKYRAELESYIEVFAKNSILTIAETKREVKNSAIISLYTNGSGRLRFSVNSKAIEPSQLKLNYKLLTLAEIVYK